MSAARPASRPEHWSAQAAARDVVKLDIPADAARERRFELSVRLVVANRAGRRDATHTLRVHVDGALEWERAAPTPSDGHDALELRLVRTVPVGRPLRVTAACQLGGGAQRVSLAIDAEES